MKDACLVLVSILAGASIAVAFHGYWLGAWVGLALLAVGVVGPKFGIVALAGAYLGGLLFHLLALGWMRCALSNAEALALAHYFALGWVITAAILRLLSRSYMCIAMPIAWTIGTAAPVLLLVTCFGRVGYFYMNRIAQTQVSVPVVQVADLAGMAGVEFLIAAAAGAIVDRHVRPLMACALVLIGVCLYAQIRMDNMATAGTIRTALLQKCVPPTEDIRAELYVWPEGNRWQEWSDAKWSRFADRLGGIAVVGVSRTDGPREYNSVLLATRDCVRYVDKRFLVAGGETPSPVDWATGNYSRKQLFAAGQGPACCECNGILLSVCICYEVTIPRLVPAETVVIINPGSERRIACANGPATMLNHARLRAIEMRRPLVRSILGGYTAIIDGNGRIIGSTIGQPLVGDLPLDSRFSLYSAVGDWITPLCAVLGVLLFVRARRHT